MPVMAAKLSPEQASGARCPARLSLAAQLEHLASERDRGRISRAEHAIAKARLLASNTP